MDLRAICIFGAGAIGGHLAAKLAAAGHAVAAVARGPNLEALRTRGIALREGARSYTGRVRATSDAAELGPQDVVFVTTKATALGAFAAAAPSLLHPGTLVVFAQNGVPWWYAQGLGRDRPPPPDLSCLDPGGRLARAIDPSQVVGAVVYSSNHVVAPGEIDNISEGRNMLVVGQPADRPSPRIDALRVLLERSGMPSPPATDIRCAVWDKLVNNLGAALCVPLGEPIGALYEDAQLLAARERLLGEGRAIARAHGVALENAPKRPGGKQFAGSARHKPSMLQDYEAGRPMEVEAILRAPCAFARAAGVEVPALEQLAALVAGLAARKGLYAAPVRDAPLRASA
jgi:2-dehydropantoate 2-reductase